MNISENFNSVTNIHVCDFVEGLDTLIFAANHLIRNEVGNDVIEELNLDTKETKTYKLIVTQNPNNNEYKMMLIDYDEYIQSIL